MMIMDKVDGQYKINYSNALGRLLLETSCGKCLSTQSTEVEPDLSILN